MADFDVEPVGLTTPPQASYLETYRPAVATRNNGIHPADVTGYLRIYDAATGLLIFTTDLAVLNVQPGDTRDALGATHWTPEEVGDYRVIATVTTPKDQVPGNDNLSPVTIHVSEEPPPPPPPVQPHAPQHESGGADQISVDGLHGTLADGQPLQPHAATHMTDGTDEMSVEGMSGELADEQKPKTHANEAHDPPFVTAIALTEHNTSQTAHDASENLEHVAAKGQADGYCNLDGNALVEPARLAPDLIEHGFLRVDQTWASAKGPVIPLHDDFIYTEDDLPPGEDVTVKTVVLDLPTDTVAISAEGNIQFYLTSHPNPNIVAAQLTISDQGVGLDGLPFYLETPNGLTFSIPVQARIVMPNPQGQITVRLIVTNIGLNPIHWGFLGLAVVAHTI